MSQNDWGTINPSTKTGTALASDLNGERDASQSTHKGSSEPSYLKTGMLWLDDSANPLWILKLYDGADWIDLFEIDVTNNTHITKAVKDGALRTDGANIGQIQDSSFTYIGTTSGTNTLITTATPTLTAYATGSIFMFTAGGTNTTTTPTLNIDGIGAITIQKKGAALAAGDITVNDIVIVVYDSATFQMISPQVLGTAALLNTGTGAGELPTNGDLGALSLLDTVSSSEIDDTTVSAGSFTSADITVDAQGRLTAAANGSSGGLINVQTFTVSGTWTKPAGTNSIEVELCGGGGGARGNTGDGANGGTTSFGAHLQATGGGRGRQMSDVVPVPGIGSGGDINCRGSVPVGGDTDLSTPEQAVGGASFFGGTIASTIADGANAETPGAGGSSHITTGGQEQGGASGGYSAKYIDIGIGATETVTIGAAGNGGPSGNEGGDGAKGIVIVRSYA